MFYCFDCGAEFEEPATQYENQGEFWGAPAWEAFGACPECGSTEIDEMRRCQRCGEWTIEGEWADVYLCPICYDDLYGG